MIKKIVLIVATYLVVAGCSNKLDILSPYKESINVYGLLDQHDTAQYIRIQRVFLGAGSALSMAQNQDSVYFKPGELTVKMQCFNTSGTQLSVDSPGTSNMEIPLTEAYIETSPGIFDTHQLLYKTKHTLYTTYQYKLLIHNNKTGTNFSAQTGLIEGFSINYTNHGNIVRPNPTGGPPPTPIDIFPSFGGQDLCVYGSPVNASICSLTARFYYTETKAGNSVQKYVDISAGDEYTAQALGGEEMDFFISGDGALQSIANAIPIDQQVSQRTADKIDFVLTAGGYDLALYNQVNSSTSLSQSKPLYTNILGGVGIFSCRTTFILPKGVLNSCKDRLDSSSKTCQLNFVNSTGGMRRCQPH